MTDLNLLDITILIVFALYFFAGIRQGFFVTLGAFAGFLLGAFAAAYVSPWVISRVDPAWHLLAGLGAVIACLVVGQMLGMTLGSTLRRLSDKTSLRVFERFLGGILSTLLSALVILTIVLVVRPLGVPAVTAVTAQSKVVTWMMATTPPGLQQAVNEARAKILTASGLPEISELLFPVQSAPTEPLDNPALAAASQSVLQIVGSAEQCSYTSEGSGFLLDGGLVATNAHVVAGVNTPTLLALDGQAVTGQVVYLDQERDIALIAAPALKLNPLTLVGTEVPAGSTVSFMGYPGGGAFKNLPATVQGLGYTKTVDAQTGQTNPSRLVYQLAADVQQGNSGGPVLTEDGQVMAMIFAKSTQGQTGYAVPASDIAEALTQVSASSPAVATGQCVAG